MQSVGVFTVTKKDFEKLAKAINTLLQSNEIPAVQAALFVQSVSHVCAESNRNFDEKRFLEACVK
jgi:hypothetical protein